MSGSPQPFTRRVADPKRRARYTQKILKRLSGERLVFWANLVSRLRGFGLTFEYDVVTKHYLCNDGQLTHRFAHPKRIFTVFNGLNARGVYLSDVYMFDLVDLQDNDWVVDVGANSGDITLAYGALKKRVNVVAFEPAPIEFSVMSANTQKSPFVETSECHQLALWHSDNEELTFYLKSAKADNSLLEISDPDEVIKVATGRLDKVLEPRDYKLLKLEAEGAEPEILQGAENILHRFEYISADVGFERGVRSESTMPQVVNFLLSRGFEIAGFNGARLAVLFKRVEK